MPASSWFHPPRHLVLVFLLVAVTSTAVLGWLTLELLAQDRAAEQQRRRERVEQAADTAALEMARRLDGLERSISAGIASAGSLPDGILSVTWAGDRLTVTPPAGLPYWPARSSPPPFSEGLSAAERLELAANDLSGAARAYAALASSAAADDVRATAWARLARVHRKDGATDAALDAYARLLEFDRSIVDGLPAVLVARVGRASIFTNGGDSAQTQQEARELREQLQSGRLQLTRSEYTYYSGEVAKWLGQPAVDDHAAVARADAVEWLWSRRAELSPSDRRLVRLDAGATLVLWSLSRQGENASALIIGADELAALAAASLPRGFEWTIADLEGRVVAGQPSPPRLATTRTPAATHLPWTLHIFDASGEPPDASPRRTLLLFVLASVAALLVAGWYFIWRGISREVRLAHLQADFVAAVSHEFRSPLTSLRHIGELLTADRFASEVQRRRSYSLLTTETDRLGRLVEGLLDFARFQAGSVTMHRAAISADQLLTTAVDEFRNRPANEGRAMVVARSTAAVVLADAELLKRALGNLLDNAAKYSPADRAITVSAEIDPARCELMLSVSDEGMGIPAHEQRAIFDRFVRGGEAKARRIQGTGIGLALVQEIARAHHGRIDVRSEPEAGSTFTLRLPLAEAPFANAELSTDPALVQPAPTPLGRQ